MTAGPTANPLAWLDDELFSSVDMWSPAAVVALSVETEVPAAKWHAWLEEALFFSVVMWWSPVAVESAGMVTAGLTVVSLALVQGAFSSPASTCSAAESTASDARSLEPADCMIGSAIHPTLFRLEARSTLRLSPADVANPGVAAVGVVGTGVAVAGVAATDVAEGITEAVSK